MKNSNMPSKVATFELIRSDSQFNSIPCKNIHTLFAFIKPFSDRICQPYFNKLSCYDETSVCETILYQIVMAATKKQKGVNVCITFNYNMPHASIGALTRAILDTKMFSSQQVHFAHFEVKNGHLSDYNRGGLDKKHKLDELDAFEREIDNCIKLDSFWRINKLVTFKPLNRKNIEEDISRKDKRNSIEKRTNEFFVYELGQQLQVAIVVLPRCKQYVLSRPEEKEINQLFVIRENTTSSIQFKTALAQIMHAYFNFSCENILVSSYPQGDKTLEEALALPIRMANRTEHELERIIDSYNSEKLSKLKEELAKMQNKLKEIKLRRKTEEESVNFIMKKYKKTFQSTFDSLVYLRKNRITNIERYGQWLRKEINSKTAQIAEEQHELKELNRSIIEQAEQHIFFVEKFQQLYERVCQNNKEFQKSLLNKEDQHESLMRLINGSFDQDEYKEFKEDLEEYKLQLKDKMKDELQVSQEKKEFSAALAELKGKVSKGEYSKIEQRYMQLINLDK